MAGMFDDLDETINLKPEEREELVRKLKTSHFKESVFDFINDHHGLRKGKTHVLMGTSGTGKSTLTRSALLDMARNHKVMLYSTEEDREDTVAMFHLRNVEPAVAKNITFVHETEILKLCKNNVKDLQAWAGYVKMKMMASFSEILFLDNLTTSCFYDGNPYQDQISFLSELRALRDFLKVPVFVVAHTKKGIKDDQQTLLGPDDVRGPQALTNNAEYLYAYQKFITKSKGESEPAYGIVRVLKARGVGNINSIYMLNYDHDRKDYYSDEKISFGEFNKIYKDRQKLGGAGD